jgi:hypothetical protein
VELERLFVLRDSEPFWMTGSLSLSRDSRGRYHATSVRIVPGVMQLLDSTGRRIGKYGNGEGRGPGEGSWLIAPWSFGPGDTAYVYDSVLRRFNVWSPDLKFMRSFIPPGAPISALTVGYDRMIIAADVPSREHAGWPLHIIRNDNGAIVRSFGAEQPAYRSDAPYLNRRLLAFSGPNRIWSGRVTEYTIEEWDLDGRLLRTLRRDASWFRPHDGRGRGPKPFVQSLWTDQDGLLWVMLMIPDPNYEQNYSKLRDPGDGMGPYIQPADNHGLMDVMIEVIDPTAGRVVAARQFPDYMKSHGNGAPIQVYREDAEGNPQFEVYRARLKR